MTAKSGRSIPVQVQALDRGWHGLALALLAGLSLPFAFAPYGYWPLAFIAIAILYALVRRVTLRQALWVGGCFGSGYFSIGVYWIYYSLHLFGEAIAPLAAGLTLLFVLVMVLFCVLCCGVFVRCGGSSLPAPLRVLCFSACWVGAELLRGWLFGGFPWLLLGYSQIDSVLSGYAPVLGVYGVSVAAVITATALVEIVLVRQRLMRSLCALLLVSTAVVANWLRPVIWSEPLPDVLSVRLVQGNIEQALKFSQERLESSLRTYVALSREAPTGTDLIIWPETAIPTLFDRVDAALRPFVEELQQRGIDVLSGGFHRDDADRIYNSVRQLGGAEALYNKRHLVPFGEFMPFRFLLDPIARFIVIPMSDLSAGDGPLQPLAVAGQRLGVSICYEDVFGEEMRALLPASTVLVNVSNDAWFGDSPAPHQHQQMAQMRAREFDRPLLRVTNTGVSASIDHRGKVQQSIPLNQAGAIDVDVSPRSGATPYVRLGNAPVIAFVVLALTGMFWRARRHDSASIHGSGQDY